MSMQKVQEFLNRVANDANLRQQLGENATVEQLISVAKSHGLEITSGDIAEAKAAGTSVVELTDADLDQVAGGCFLSLIGRKKPGGSGEGEGEVGTEAESEGGGQEETRTPKERLEDLTSGPVNPKGPPGPLTSQTPLLC